MYLDEEVDLDSIPEAETMKRSDEPSKTCLSGGESFGHGAAHIVEVYKIPKMIPTGEPYKIGGINWQDSVESETEFEYEVDIVKHHASCDELAYGQECSLDDYLTHDGWRELLESSQFSEPHRESPEGFWKVWVCWEKSFVNSYSHYGWEYETYLDFIRVEKPQELR